MRRWPAKTSTKLFISEDGQQKQENQNLQCDNKYFKSNTATTDKFPPNYNTIYIRRWPIKTFQKWP